MKHIILAIVALFVTAVSMNAQVAAGSKLEYRGGSFYQNGTKLTSDQLCNALGQDVYNTSYKQAKSLRVSGITLLSVGGTATAVGAGLLIHALASDSAGETLTAIPAVYIGIPGVIVTAAGGVLLGVGNKKMKKILPASNGAGIALAF